MPNAKLIVLVDIINDLLQIAYLMFVIGEKSLVLEGIWAWLEKHEPVAIYPSVKARVDASRKVVEECLADKTPHYGINTGYGSLANTRIPDDKLNELQYNYVRSHSCGVGEPLHEDIVRVMAMLRANVLAMGFSGVRYELLEYLVDFINKGKLPKIPSQGSVGASGDLAPLAHLALALVNDGLKLAPKEALALTNGVQASLGVAVVALLGVSKLIDQANIAAALAIEGLRGSDKPFDDRIADARRFMKGHAEIARIIRELINNSQIIASHRNCSRVQDPYSLRCVPQVHGAVLDAYNYAFNLIEGEVNSCTDNPLIFGKDIISGGNFHGQSIAFACDHLSNALTALGNISERRIEQMTNPKQGELPVKHLTKDAGINSGFMIAHVVASSLASENKALSFPASSDSVTTNAGQEDFVSMSMWAARKLLQIISNTKKIIAIELLAAAQAVDMQENRFPLGNGTQKIYDSIRKNIPVLEKDRELYKDIEKMLNLMDTFKLPQ